MDEPFRGIPFAEPDRSQAALRQIVERLPESLRAALPSLLGQLPDPDEALDHLERFLQSESPDRERAIANLARDPAAFHHLLCVFSYSRFLSETLVQQPDLVLQLHRPGARHPLERLKSVEDLQADFARFEATTFDQPPGVVLTRFKRREYLRIMLRDVLGIASLTETTLELSRLADVLFDRAHRICDQRLLNAYGAPQYTDPSGRRLDAHLTILSLGKLGAEELNYSSDVDLMFLYSQDGETAGGTSGSISNAEYFVRLAQAILKLVTEPTPEGAAFRVDLRLRPQGSEGDLAVSLATALDYYRSRAREWELQMLIKARPSTGFAPTGRVFLRELRPLIYRPEFNVAAVEAVLNARAEITRELRRPRGTSDRPAEHAAAWNVKLSPGGIRDIEFLTQCLQRLYGGADPWLAVPATLAGLQRLHDKGFLSSGDFQHLAAAYELLRRVEHRLQLRDGLQRHTLPEQPDALDRLARRCGVDSTTAHPGELLRQRISTHFAEVGEIYGRILQTRISPPAAEPAVAAPEPERTEDALLRRLRRDFPHLAAAAGTASDAYARRGLHGFLSSALLEPELMKQLESNPQWISRAAGLFSRSDLLAEMLARHPGEIAALAEPAPEAFHRPLAADGGDFRQSMAALRICHRRGVLSTLVRSLSSPATQEAEPYATFGVLTRLAEEAVAGAIELAARETLGETALRDAPFAVVALGRMGTHEMDIGSDADLVFVLDDTVAPEHRDPWRRLAERFVHVVSSHTADGLLFPVDTRLRPRGTEGEIVQTASAICAYFRTDARAWEAATYLKARPVAGNLALATAAVASIHTAVRERFAPSAPELARQLAETRARLERETTGARAKGEFKKVSGGYYDIEYLTAFLALTRLPQPPAPAPVVRQLAAFEGALAAEDMQKLGAAATLFRAVDHAVRIITGRPTHHLPDSALAERAAGLIQGWGIPLDGSLEVAVRRVRENTRAMYKRVVLTAARA